MKKKIIRILSLALVFAVMIPVVHIPAIALEWDGDSEGGFAGDL